jgi:DNA damage-binding protein 1
MFLSFAFFGSLPILGYVIFPKIFPDYNEKSLFIDACIVTGVVLFFMGCVKSYFLSSYPGIFKKILFILYCGTETLLLGGACATVSYTIAKLVDSLVTEGIAEQVL